MEYEKHEKRMNAEIDRLSNLPDDLIHNILSFAGIECAIELSALSSRWRYIWTSMPYLDFSILNFSTSARLSIFVTDVLSRRNNLVEVFSVKLHAYKNFSPDSLRQIMNYAFSHNVKQLDIHCFPENDNGPPLPFFYSESLKHLSLRWRTLLTPTSIIELPALTSLYLKGITLSCDENTENTDKCIGLFSKCANLKDLTLKNCKVIGLNRLEICHPLLSNLTIKNVRGSLKVVNVVAPQLKSLSIIYLIEKLQFLISAPDLVSLCYKNHEQPLHLSTEGFLSLEKADICVSHSIASAHEYVCLFQQLGRVKFLTLNMEILERLSSSVELISNQPSPFANLESLHIYPVTRLRRLSDVQNGVQMSTEVKNYLLDSSPSAKFTMVSREEIRDKEYTELALTEMASLRVILDQEKTKTESRITQVENLLQTGRSIAHLNKSWEVLNDRIEKGRSKTDEIISELQNIKYTLTKLSISKRAEMQKSFSSLCSEAYDVANKIMYLVKILCDMKVSRFRVCFDELSAISEPSS